jgi:DNA-binding response OmpR family regulator
MPHPRVLVVDDEAEFRRLAFRYFNTHAGFECIAAADAGQALELSAKSSPDLILLDVLMRGMNGFDVLKALRTDQRTAATPVIIMTGDAGSADLLASACKNMAVSGFVRKPFDWADLSALIRKTLAANPKSLREAPPNVITRGPLRIDVKLRRAFVKGKPLKLGPRRFELLLTLSRSKDGFPSPVLCALIWGSNRRASHVLIETVRRLRADLQRACGQELIINIPGGYKLL